MKLNVDDNWGVEFHAWPGSSGHKRGARKSFGYWVKVGETGNGIQVYEITETNHLHFIIQNPDLFHVPYAEIVALHQKYGERFGIEGKAREQIIRQVAKAGWIRIRHYDGAENYWSIQCDDIDSRKRGINAFIHWATHQYLEPEQRTSTIMNLSDPLKVFGYESDEYRTYSFADKGVARFLSERILEKPVTDTESDIETIGNGRD